MQLPQPPLVWQPLPWAQPDSQGEPLGLGGDCHRGIRPQQLIGMQQIFFEDSIMPVLHITWVDVCLYTDS